jgi:S-adenosylmethionine decarboxylase
VLEKDHRKPVRSPALFRAEPGAVPRSTEDHSPLSMRLWAMDAWVRHAEILTDLDRLNAILHEAAFAGGATVLGEKFCVFDNGAVTGVLVLAQSHLSIHTWPERRLANVDLLSYGDLGGEEVVRRIGRTIGADHMNVACLMRGVP